jgi:hypothetical protein
MRKTTVEVAWRETSEVGGEPEDIERVRDVGKTGWSPDAAARFG